MPEDILPIKEVADCLEVTERTLYRLAQEGKVPAFTVRGSWRFERADIETWIEARKSSQVLPDDAGEED